MVLIAALLQLVLPVVMIVTIAMYGGQAFPIYFLVFCILSPVSVAFAFSCFTKNKNKKERRLLVITTLFHILSILTVFFGNPLS
jgi:small neutral amino acid transporter SnatA (MarC family)